MKWFKVCDKMLNLNIKERILHFNETESFSDNYNIMDLSNDQIKLNLVNPKEIFDFIKDKDGIMEFILETHGLIKKYYPKAFLYLKYVEDPEFREMDILFTYIINPEGNFKDDMFKYDDLLSEFVSLKNYEDFCTYYSISLRAEI